METVVITAHSTTAAAQEHLKRIVDLLAPYIVQLFKSLSTLSPNFAVVSPFSATIALFCDNMDRA